MKNATALKAALASAPIVPVLTIPDDIDAAKLASTFQATGLKAIEVTLRTHAALQAITDMKSAAPELLVGSGTVTNRTTLEAAISAGADFHVSPGMTRELHEAVQDNGVTLLPGIATPSEAMERANEGYDFLKLFPAGVVGGPDMLKAMASPLPHLSFMPTGGVREDNLSEYTRLPNVVAVGGTWLAPVNDIKNEKWLEIEARIRGALYSLETSPTTPNLA